MRERPLLLVLDEPTASLDAHAEHVLFERYAESARAVARATGGIAVFSLAPLLDADGGSDRRRRGRPHLRAGDARRARRRRRHLADLFALQAAAYAG